MDILVNVVGQQLKISKNLKNLVSGSQEFIRFMFSLEEDWNGLTVFAQFIQDGVPYNQYLDSENCAYLPAEIGEGTCTLMLYGTKTTTIATTNYLTLTITKDIFVGDAYSTEISQSLYNQLVDRVSSVLTGIESNRDKIELLESSKVSIDQYNELAIKVSEKAPQTQVTELATKVESKASQDAVTQLAIDISGKASAQKVEEIETRLDNFAQSEDVLSTIETSVRDELNEYLESGKLASMTITDGSVSEDKLDQSVNIKLQAGYNAMQPLVYDPQNIASDIFEYAKGKADAVQTNVTAISQELTDAYKVDNTNTYDSLGNAVRGALSLAKSYTDNSFANFKSFNIVFVGTLPSQGVPYTFYLVPNKSGTGYDKYLWITDGSMSKWEKFGGSTTTVVDSLSGFNPSEEVDYILKTNGGYLYYKYIDNEWQLIAGTLAYVNTQLPTIENGNEFTDYYIGSGNNYKHYRFINGAYKLVGGGDSYTKAEIDNKFETVNGTISGNTSNIQNLSQTVGRIDSELQNIDTEGYMYYQTLEQDEETENYLLLLHQIKGESDEVISTITLPATGGGGGGTTTMTKIEVDRITPSPLIVTPSDRVNIEINFSSKDMEGQSVDANYTWKIGNSVIASGVLVQGYNAFDLTDHIQVGTQRLSLNIVDEAGTTSIKFWTVQKVDLRIESTFNDKTTYALGRSVSFNYIPYGGVSKTIHFKIDGEDYTTIVSSSGILQTYTIPPQSYGAHLVEVWATATINNVDVETNHIFKNIIWYDPIEDGEAIIASIYRNDYYGTATVRQYDTLPIEYSVYDPTTNFPVVQRYINDILVGTETLTTNHSVWNYKSDTVGTNTLKLVSRNTILTIVVETTELGIEINPVVNGLEIDFNPVGITNDSDNRIWSNENYTMSVSPNFNWANGGYRVDENGDTYFLVKAGDSISFDYQMFGGGTDRNPSILGAEMKVVFMTENVQDANAVWFSNVETTNTPDGSIDVGIQMSVHEAWLKTNAASDTDVDDGSETISATNTYLYMPYSEEDIIELDINIDTIVRNDDTSKSFVMGYEDGVPAKAYVYDAGHRFYQYNPKPMVIGSDKCDVRIYRLKVYSNSLSTEDIKRNFIADSRNSDIMLQRYDRNCIYYNRELGVYTPYSGEGELIPELLATKIPNVKVLMLDTDHFTTSKKTFVKSTLRCIHAPGGDLYPGDPYYDNWFFENGWHSGQGTTSDNYGNAGRNVDFLFNCDGIHKPSDKVDAESNYISKVTIGYNTENAVTETVTDWKGASGKVSLTRTSVPNNFFNLKLNIASSENVNNALLQKRYNDYLPYISPAKKRDSRIKNDMEFVPAVLFIRENNPDISTHKEFLDTNWHFYGLGNLGDSKKTDYTRAYDPTDKNEFTIEISDNTKNNATFQSGVYMDGSGQLHYEPFHIEKSYNKDNELVLTPVPDVVVNEFVRQIPASRLNDLWYKQGTITVVNKTGDPEHDGNMTGYLNMRAWTLYNEPFNGDNSFEPRYACCGDYRDGKLVNDTGNGGKEQIAINEDVWRAFYLWVITATDAEFVAQLDEWCVRSAVEFFYAFTHMYTMMDNRAKNTFWHFAKTGSFRRVTKPVKELLHIYCEKVGDEYVPTTDNEISSKTYYTEYAFDLWDYDNDTALGIKC